MYKTCPNCGKEYATILNPTQPDMAIQDEFPTAEPWQREQCITGICSDECWDAYLLEDPSDDGDYIDVEGT